MNKKWHFKALAVVALLKNKHNVVASKKGAWGVLDPHRRGGSAAFEDSRRGYFSSAWK